MIKFGCTYVPSVKSGNTKKLASLWHGPYTVIDRINLVNYKIQLISQPAKTLVVHHNHLKLCFGTPQCPPAPPEVSPHSSGALASPTLEPRLLYSTVLSMDTPSPGGYTSSDNSIVTPPTTTAASPPVSTAPRPYRSRQPPDRYADFIRY